MNEELLNAMRAMLKEELDPIKQAINRVESKIDVIAEQSNGDVVAMLQIMDKKLDDIKKDVEFTYLKASQNELEINRLKHQ